MGLPYGWCRGYSDQPKGPIMDEVEMLLSIHYPLLPPGHVIGSKFTWSKIFLALVPDGKGRMKQRHTELLFCSETT